jgi:hypothetical protein
MATTAMAALVARLRCSRRAPLVSWSSCSKIIAWRSLPVYHHCAQPAHLGGDAELAHAGSPQAFRSIPDPYGRRHPENT